MVRLADGTALAGKKYLGQYTVMRSQDLVALLRQHPDAHFILDSKWSRFEIYKTILSQAPERSVRERIMPHI